VSGVSTLGGANSLSLCQGRHAPMTFFTNATERMRILAGGNVGIGTTTPYKKLSVVGDIVAQHLHSTSTAPVVTSCGTSPSAVGSDGAGKVTLGTTIGVDNDCTVTFSKTWVTVPSCMANNESQVLLVRTVTTATTLTLSVAATFTDSDVISYICLGN